MLGTSGTGQATVESGVFVTQNAATGLCLDIGANTVGTRVVQSWCHFDQRWDSQRWYVVTDSNNQFNVVSVSSGLCMDIGANTVGTQVFLSWCHLEAGYSSQKWTGPYKTKHIVSASNNLCWDIGGLHGMPLVLAGCHWESSWSSQLWNTYG